MGLYYKNVKGKAVDLDKKKVTMMNCEVVIPFKEIEKIIGETENRLLARIELIEEDVARIKRILREEGHILY